MRLLLAAAAALIATARAHVAISDAERNILFKNVPETVVIVTKTQLSPQQVGIDHGNLLGKLDNRPDLLQFGGAPAAFDTSVLTPQTPPTKKTRQIFDKPPDTRPGPPQFGGAPAAFDKSVLTPQAPPTPKRIFDKPAKKVGAKPQLPPIFENSMDTSEDYDPDVAGIIRAFDSLSLQENKAAEEKGRR
jgi:hypothetical protein